MLYNVKLFLTYFKNIRAQNYNNKFQYTFSSLALRYDEAFMNCHLMLSGSINCLLWKRKPKTEISKIKKAFKYDMVYICVTNEYLASQLVLINRQFNYF